MKVKIYSNEQFKKAGKLERLYMYMMQPDDFVLTDAETRYLDKLKCAFVLFSECYTKTEMYMKFNELYTNWASERHRIFRDTQELFGRFEKVNSNLLRAKLTENLMSALELARLENDTPNIVAVSLAISRINRLEKPEAESQETIETPSKVVFVVKEKEKDGESNRSISETGSVPTIDSED